MNGRLQICHVFSAITTRLLVLLFARTGIFTSFLFARTSAFRHARTFAFLFARTFAFLFARKSTSRHARTFAFRHARTFAFRHARTFAFRHARTFASRHARTFAFRYGRTFAFRQDRLFCFSPVQGRQDNLFALCQDTPFPLDARQDIPYYLGLTGQDIIRLSARKDNFRPLPSEDLF